MKLQAVLLLAFLPTVLFAAPPTDLSPVKAWIERQAGLRTLIADFKQERHLRTVKKPLESSGRIWLTVGGPFRWQTGDPPKVLAILGTKGEFTIINVEKKTAEVISPEALEKDQAGQALAFLRAGFPASLDDFQKKFEVTEITQEADWDKVEMKPAGGGGSFAVRKMVMYLHRERHILGAMQVHLRDGSWISNTFSGIQENPKIPAAQFATDLSGYTVKRK